MDLKKNHFQVEAWKKKKVFLQSFKSSGLWPFRETLYFIFKPFHSLRITIFNN